MDWIGYLLTAMGGSVTALVGSIIYFRPKLKEAQASADMKEVEAQNFLYDSLMNRVNSIEKMYNEQGEIINRQNVIIAELRSEIIKMSEEKFSSEKRMLQLEAENKEFRSKVDQLEKEVSAYRTITGRKK